MQAGQVLIQNIYANDADNAKKVAGMLDRTIAKLTLNDYTWIQRSKIVILLQMSKQSR